MDSGLVAMRAASDRAGAAELDHGQEKDAELWPHAARTATGDRSSRRSGFDQSGRPGLDRRSAATTG